MPLPSPALVQAVLNALDRHQARAMRWGFFDLTVDIDEVTQVLEEGLDGTARTEWGELAARGYTVEQLLFDLEAANLVVEDRLSPGTFRTLFAEGTRLIANLRQIFRRDDWATAPSLVSDVKVQVADRRYPRRDQPVDACWADLAPHAREPDLQRELLRRLAAKDGTLLEFAAFQRRAFRRIIAAYGASEESGTMISAGTGAGKTKAFYVPAMLGIAGDIAAEPSPWTKVIAVYPRNVLLADQLREAISEAAKLRGVLESQGMRQITFGAMVGSTPNRMADFEAHEGRAPYAGEMLEWKRVGQGWVIPFLRSPVNGDPLVWRDGDRTAGVAALYPAGSTGGAPHIPPGTLTLTRDEMFRSPPDVLFISIEMLNRLLAHPKAHALLGINCGQRTPRLLLLDEVHTYEDIAGAQAAWVMRRWRHWGQFKHLHAVGLSATLNRPEEHLAGMTGIPLGQIVQITPVPEDLETDDVGAEYTLLLKGNPAAGASLLATSIQTALLLPRLMTPRGPQGRRAGIDPCTYFGTKVFAFSDRLDTINRWHGDLRDADATKRLAAVRRTAGAEPAGVLESMERHGQLWRLPERLGHDLSAALRITRCSSQDPGADAESDLIVATASLEVGYDDPDVGGTLHHKRPRSLASFLQRKGRAGRRRRRRPWTVVVLSDYGVDRWTFQNEHLLFSPDLPDVRLPVRNVHVLRMQANAFLMDWIALRLGGGSAFSYLGPPSPKGDVSALGRERRNAADLLRDVLQFGRAYHEFCRQFEACFGATRQESYDMVAGLLEDVLWRSPRPLLLDAVPELLRQLESDWTYRALPGGRPQIDPLPGTRPLARHRPDATFGDLGLVETQLDFGPGRRSEHLAAEKALFEATPGNVSMRYALRHRERGYWSAVSAQLADGGGTCSIDEIAAEHQFAGRIGKFEIREPIRIVMQEVPNTVKRTSRASWRWQVAVDEVGSGIALPVLTTPSWNQVVAHCTAFLHANHCRLELYRYSAEAQYDIGLDRGGSRIGTLRIKPRLEGELQQELAIGVRKEVDGVIIDIRSEHLAACPTLDAETWPTLRADYLRDGIRQTTSLGADVSVFVRDWLADMALAMLMATAAQQSCSLQEAQEALRDKRLPAARKVLDAIFQVVDLPDGGEQEARLRTRLLELWADPAVVRAIADLEPRLWMPPDEDMVAWLRRRHVATLAQALRAAAVARVPDVNEDDVLLDVLDGPRGTARIVMAERESGGLGIVERMVREIRRDPEAFHSALEHHLAWCPREDLGANLLVVLERSVGTDETAEAFRQTFRQARSARRLAEAERVTRQLTMLLDEVGLEASRTVLSAVTTRLLQPGTPDGVEELMAGLLRQRQQLAATTGVLPPSTVFAYCMTTHAEFRPKLDALLHSVGGVTPTAAQVFAIVRRLLHEGCHDSCPECLDQPNWMTDFGRPSRRLSQHWLPAASVDIEAEREPDWPSLVIERLAEVPAVVVRVRADRMAPERPRLQGLLAREVERGFLPLPITLQSIRRQADRWLVRLVVRDADHA